MYAYYSTDQIFVPSIKVTYFKNLHVIDIIVLNPSLVDKSLSIKSSINLILEYDIYPHSHIHLR